MCDIYIYMWYIICVHFVDQETESRCFFVWLICSMNTVATDWTIGWFTRKGFMRVFFSIDLHLQSIFPWLSYYVIVLNDNDIIYWWSWISIFNQATNMLQRMLRRQGGESTRGAVSISVVSPSWKLDDSLRLYHRKGYFILNVYIYLFTNFIGRTGGIQSVSWMVDCICLHFFVFRIYVVHVGYEHDKHWWFGKWTDCRMRHTDHQVVSSCHRLAWCWSSKLI